MQEKTAEIALLILAVCVTEMIGIIGLNWLLFIKSRPSMSFKEFINMRLAIIIITFITFLIIDILMIIFSYFK